MKISLERWLLTLFFATIMIFISVVTVRLISKNLFRGKAVLNDNGLQCFGLHRYCIKYSDISKITTYDMKKVLNINNKHKADIVKHIRKEKYALMMEINNGKSYYMFLEDDNKIDDLKIYINEIFKEQKQE